VPINSELTARFHKVLSTFFFDWLPIHLHAHASLSLSATKVKGHCWCLLGYDQGVSNHVVYLVSLETLVKQSWRDRFNLVNDLFISMHNFGSGYVCNVCKHWRPFWGIKRMSMISFSDTFLFPCSWTIFPSNAMKTNSGGDSHSFPGWHSFPCIEICLIQNFRTEYRALSNASKTTNHRLNLRV